MSETVLQWTPKQGPRRKLTLKQIEDSWVRIETVWDGQQWRETGYEQIEDPTVHTDLPNTNPTPPTIETLCTRIHHTWQTENPQLLQFNTEQPIVIAATDTKLRYYSQRSTHWKPIDDTTLRRLIRKHGVPSVTSLADTPYSRTQLEQGGPDE